MAKEGGGGFAVANYNTMNKKNVAIIGVGLIGGSLGMALRRSGQYRVVGIGRSNAKLAAAKKRGAVDSFTVDHARGVCDADIVVVCTPVDSIASQIKKIVAHCKPGAVITDAGSVKGFVIKEVAKVLSTPRNRTVRMPVFVGAHPMAGLEKNGLAAATGDLYKNATVVIAGTIHASASQIDCVKRMWRCAGGRICELDPKDHDAIVAMTSHVPHVVAYGFGGLTETLQGKQCNAVQLMAGSFKDMTRVAAASPADWARICRANRTEITKTLTALIRYLSLAKKNLNDTAALEKLFEKGHRVRCNLHALDH